MTMRSGTKSVALWCTLARFWDYEWSGLLFGAEKGNQERTRLGLQKSRFDGFARAPMRGFQEQHVPKVRKTLYRNMYLYASSGISVRQASLLARLFRPVYPIKWQLSLWKDVDKACLLCVSVWDILSTK